MDGSSISSFKADIKTPAYPNNCGFGAEIGIEPVQPFRADGFISGHYLSEVM